MKSTIKLVQSTPEGWRLLTNEIAFPNVRKRQSRYYFIPRRTKHPSKRYVHIQLTKHYSLRVKAADLSAVHILATYLNTLATELEDIHKANLQQP